MNKEGLIFVMAGMLGDAAKMLPKLTGQNLEAYCATFAVLAKTAVDEAVKQQIIPDAPAEYRMVKRITLTEVIEPQELGDM